MRFRSFIAVLVLLVFPVLSDAKPCKKKECPMDIMFTFDEPAWEMQNDGHGLSQITGTYGFKSPSVALSLLGYNTGALGSVGSYAPPVPPFYPPLNQLNYGIPGFLPGRLYRVSAWINADGVVNDNTQLQIELTSYLASGLQQVFHKSQLAPGFNYVEWTVECARPDGLPFPPEAFDSATTVAMALGIVSFNPGADSLDLYADGRWLVDDVGITQLSEADMKKWNAISGALSVLKGINGATGNYNNDFGSTRVYTRLFTPSEQQGVKLPYACLTLTQEAEDIKYPGVGFSSVWHMKGVAFFDDNLHNDVLNSAGVILAAKFRDDLIRAFMLNYTLNHEVLEASVVSINTFAGVSTDGIAQVEFVIRFEQMGGATDLSAT